MCVYCFPLLPFYTPNPAAFVALFFSSLQTSPTNDNSNDLQYDVYTTLQNKHHHTTLQRKEALVCPLTETLQPTSPISQV